VQAKSCKAKALRITLLHLAENAHCGHHSLGCTPFSLLCERLINAILHVIADVSAYSEDALVLKFPVIEVFALQPKSIVP
jgi:hypothetical protein